MSAADDQASAPIAQISSESQVIDQLSVATEALKRIRQAKRDFANLPAGPLRGAFERRHGTAGGDGS